jgi:hypothetical protein
MTNHLGCLGLIAELRVEGFVKFCSFLREGLDGPGSGAALHKIRDTTANYALAMLRYFRFWVAERFQ